MKNLKYLEFEYKYRADNIGILKFLEFCKSRFTIVEQEEAVGTDFYFSRDSTGFLRYRRSEDHTDLCELTIKKKLDKDNNFHRIEVDLPLDIAASNFDMVKKFAETIGFKYEFRICKGSHILRTKNLHLSYYVISGKDGGSYIEIEIDKNAGLTEAEAKNLLDITENIFRPLGLTKESRLNKSLFELYKR